MKKIFSIGLCLLCTSIMSFAQNETEASTFGQVVSISQMPEQTTGFTNSSFTVFPYSTSRVYSLRGLSIVQGQVMNIRKCDLSPARNDMALLYGKKNLKVVIYSATDVNRWKKNIKAEGLVPVCLAYSPDSKTLAIASTDNYLYVFETQKYTLVRKVQINCVPSKIIVSPNNFFVVAIDGQDAKVINFETGTLRKNIKCGAEVTDIAFSLDGNLLGVLSKTKLSTFNGKTLEAMKEYTNVGNAIALAMHEDNKHAAIVTDEEHVAIVNVLNTDDHEFFNVVDGGMTRASVSEMYTGKTCIINDSRAGIMFSDLGVLEPNYGQLVSEELSARLALWEKRMPGESLEEYNSRVNDESRNQMRNSLRDEIVGKMASGLFDANDISLSYDPETQLMSIGFKKMPAIALGMLESEARSLMKPGNISLTNPVYGISDDDKIEMVYADIKNMETGKLYVYDKRAGKMNYINADDVVDLEIVKKSNMEAIKLEEIKNTVIETAKQQNLISEHTNIQVNTTPVNDIDADGNKIVNYNVSFTYEVDSMYSFKEDFPSGRYKTEMSNAAMSTLKIIKQAFETDFAEYIKAGKKVKINITGTTDSSPVNKTIRYAGEYGDDLSYPVYQGKELQTVEVSKKSGINSNEQLALLRALGVQNYIDNNISLPDMNKEYIYNMVIAKEKGSQFRRINVVFSFIDAF